MALPPIEPCSPWLKPEQICCAGSPPDAFTNEQKQAAIAEASALLFQETHYRFPGECVRTDQFCRDDPTADCSCDDPASSSCFACDPLSGSIQLGDYWPATEVLLVTVDGVVLAPSAYVLAGGRLYCYVAWGSCVEVQWRYGRAVPAALVLAAQELACWLLRRCLPPDCGDLPPGTTSMSRSAGDGSSISFRIDPNYGRAWRALPVVSRELERYGTEPRIGGMADPTRWPARLRLV